LNHKSNSRYCLHLRTIRFLLIAGALSTISYTGFSQIEGVPDTIDVEIADSVLMKQHNPTKATLMSVALPGLGQIYNGKWWKVPIIYAGFGVMTYFIYSNTDNYLIYKSAYIEKVNGNENGNYADLVERYTESELSSATEYYRRNLELSILITALWYVLNIIDATVDAHLYTYDINEDLSLRISPGLLPPAEPSFRMKPGIKLCFTF